MRHMASLLFVVRSPAEDTPLKINARPKHAARAPFTQSRERRTIIAQHYAMKAERPRKRMARYKGRARTTEVDTAKAMVAIMLSVTRKITRIGYAANAWW